MAIDFMGYKCYNARKQSGPRASGDQGDHKTQMFLELTQPWGLLPERTHALKKHVKSCSKKHAHVADDIISDISILA